MIKFIFGATALISFSLLGPVTTDALQAKTKTLEFKAVEEKNLSNGKFSFDESKGYIFLHGNSRQWGVFIKEPNQADIDAYEADWSEKFSKAKEKYERRIKKWEKLSKAKNGKAGKKPIEPTRENFSIGAIELRNAASFGPQFIFNKDKSDKNNPYFSYMIQLEPGTYVYNGPVLSIPGAATSGICYCMGSVKFDVVAGKITDLGNFLTNAPKIDNGGTSLVGPMLLRSKSPDAKQLRWLKNPVKYGLPDSLSSYEAIQANFSPSGKINNVYRAMVSRMGPVDGLFRYERDQVVDIKAEQQKAQNTAAEAQEAGVLAEELTSEKTANDGVD